LIRSRCGSVGEVVERGMIDGGAVEGAVVGSWMEKR